MDDACILDFHSFFRITFFISKEAEETETPMEVAPRWRRWREDLNLHE